MTSGFALATIPSLHSTQMQTANVGGSELESPQLRPRIHSASCLEARHHPYTARDFPDGPLPVLRKLPQQTTAQQMHPAKWQQSTPKSGTGSLPERHTALTRLRARCNGVPATPLFRMQFDIALQSSSTRSQILPSSASIGRCSNAALSFKRISSCVTTL